MESPKRPEEGNPHAEMEEQPEHEMEGMDEGHHEEGEGEGEDMDQYFDDAADIGYLPAEHPLMNRLQNALTKQLTDEHERTDLALREKEEKLRKVRQNREEIGVQLYSV